MITMVQYSQRLGFFSVHDSLQSLGIFNIFEYFCLQIMYLNIFASVLRNLFYMSFLKIMKDIPGF